MKTAMILAAGRGERLKPITDTCPKALCLIQGIPLIEYHLQALSKAGFTRIIINHAHLGEQLRWQLGNGDRWNVSIHYSPEPPGGLETGGGIVNALHYLNQAPFITVNADIMTDYDFSALKLRQPYLAHIVLIPKPTYYNQGDFGLSEEGFIHQQDRRFTFSGIACYHPALFQDLKPGRFSLTPLLRALADNQQLTGELYQGQWLDIGTPERLAIANRY